MADEREELNPNDPQVRELRARAEEYADRVAAGEEPWNDEQEPADAGFESVPEPKDDDVGETSSDSPEVVNPDEVVVNEDETV